MNRQTILQSVHRHLHESFVETGEVRPLGEIVARVAAEIRNGHDLHDVPATVIPIERVAAFVDGAVEPAESESICKAVLVDNSVLAEIVAAVRSAETPAATLPPLSDSLAARLMSMNPVVADPGHEQLATTETAVDDTLASAPIVRPRPAIPSHTRANQVRSRKVVRGVAALLALAVSILVAVFLLGRSNNEKDPDLIVDSETRLPLPAPDRVPDPVPEASPPIRDPGDAIVDSDGSRIDDDGVTPTVPSLDMTPDSTERPDQAVATSTPPESGDVVETPMPMPPPDADPFREPDRVRITSGTPRFAEIQWTNVSGLFAQRRETETTSGSRAGPKWERIINGSPSSTDAARPSKLAVRTLPFSRAEGEIPGGGRIVVASDTAMQMSEGSEGVSAEVDLMFGSVAMVGLEEGTVLRFRQGTRTLATLRWQTRASAVVQRDAAGVQIQVDGGEIAINETPVKETSVRVAGDRSVDEVRGPKRLPRWITRPDPTTDGERMILAQIAETNDLMTSLNQKIHILASSKRLTRDELEALNKLAAWQAAMAGPNLFRLASSRVPVVRAAALQRLVELRESDPRYKQTWKSIERGATNAQRVAQIRAWFVLAQSGRRPTTAQLDEIAHGLASRDYAGRALSDFILRKYVRNPPPFDPAWTGQTLQRAINIYRQRAGLPAATAIDRARPNAAAADGR